MRKNLHALSVYEPTPKTIRQECEHIQADWSDRTRQRREGKPADSRWTPPRIPLDAINAAARENTEEILAVLGSGFSDPDQQ